MAPGKVTRSHKYNDPHHGSRTTEDPDTKIPKFFAKAGGYVDCDPKKTKKEGGGGHNWGRNGDELEDEAVNMTKPRRRSNSFVDHTSHFKTKFEAVDPEPVFEEDVHGASEEDMAAVGVMPHREVPEGHDGYGISHEDEKDRSSVGSSSFSVHDEEDLGFKKA